MSESKDYAALDAYRAESACSLGAAQQEVADAKLLAAIAASSEQLAQALRDATARLALAGLDTTQQEVALAAYEGSKS